MSKNEFLPVDIKHLIDWNEPNGEGCMVSDRITKEGFKVGYMYGCAYSHALIFVMLSASC